MANKTIENIQRAARQVYGDSDYEKYLEPSFSSYEKDDYKMLLSQFNTRQTMAAETGRMFDQKAAFGEAMMAVNNYKQETASASQPDEFNDMFKTVYEAAGYNEEGEEYTYDAGEVGGSGWNSPSATFASKLGRESSQVLGYHLGTGGEHIPEGKRKAWQRNMAKAEKAGLLKDIVPHTDPMLYGDAKALGGEEHLYQQLLKHNDVANTDMFTNESVSMKKDLEMRDKNRKALNAMARSILPPDAPREWRMATMNSLFRNIPKFRRANNVGYGKYGIQSGYKSDMLKQLVQHAPSYEGRRPQLPRFMQENNGMTREEWNAERLGLQSGLDDVWDYATAGGNREYGHLFDKQEDNDFLNQIDELSRVSDENNASYLLTGDIKDALSEKDSNTLQALGLDNTSENTAKLRSYREGDLSLEEVFDSNVDAIDERKDLTRTDRVKKESKEASVGEAPKQAEAFVASVKSGSSKLVEQINKEQKNRRNKALGVGVNTQTAIQETIAVAQSGQSTQQIDDAKAHEILRASGLDVSNAPQRSQQWHDERRGILTGSTAQAMAGNPKSSIRSVLGSQAGIEERSNIMFDTIFQRGQDAEDGIQTWLGSQFKEAGLNYGIGNTGLIRNPNNPNIGYSPDGIVFDRDSGDAVGLSEYKSVGKITRGDEAWSKKYETQVQMGMALTGLDKTWHVQHRAAKGPWDTEEYHAREVNRDPNFDTNMNKIAERRALLDAYKGQREDGDLVQTLSNLSNKDVEKFSNLYQTADKVKSESDKDRIKAGLLEAYEIMAKEGGDKYPAALSNRKKEEEKAEKIRDKEEKKREKEEAKEKAERSAKYGHAFGVANNIFGGGSQQMFDGATNALSEMGIFGDIIKTATNVTKTAFTVEREFRNAVGSSMDAGYADGFGLRGARAGLESLGLDENQATSSATNISSARNLATLGDISGIQKISAGTRGLLTPEDIMTHGENPAKLMELFTERAKRNGWSQAQMAGAAELSGLQGFARGGTSGRSDDFYQSAQNLTEAGKKSGTVPQALMADGAKAATESNIMINAASNERLEAAGFGIRTSMDAINTGRQTFNSTTEYLADSATDLQKKIVSAFGKDVEAAAAKHGVESSKIYAMIEQESGGNINAVNKESGATGILQFTDDTAKDYGIDPKNPSQSIDATAKRLAEAKKKGFEGNDVYRQHFGGFGKDSWGPKTQAYGNEVAKKEEGYRKLLSVHGTNPKLYSPSMGKQEIDVNLNFKGSVVDASVQQNGKTVKQGRYNAGGGS